MSRLTFLLILIPFLAIGQEGKITNVAINSRNGNPRGYIEYLPKNYNASGNVKYPVIFWLHGTGSGSTGSGSANDLRKIENKWILNWLKAGNDIPFIVLVPQDSNGFWGSGRFQQFVEWAINHYQTIDINQLHAQGQSGGGFGLRAFIIDNSDTYKLFATFTPSSTNFSSNVGNNIFRRIIDNDQYIWFHHGVKDGNSSTQLTSVQDFHMDIYSMDPNRSRLTAYTNVGHSAWEEVYDHSGRSKAQLTGTVDGVTYYEWKPDDDTWYDWLLSHPKNVIAPTNITIDEVDFSHGVKSGTVIATLEANGTKPIEFNLIAGDGDFDNNVFLIEGNKLKITEDVDIALQASYSIRISATNTLGSFERSITLVAEKKNLIITASDASSIYGEEIPTLSFSYQGFVDGEDENSLDKKPLANTTASKSSNVGTYPITLSGGESQKYNFNYINGELSINPAELTVSVMDVNINKGETIPEFDISYQGFKNGDDENDLVKKPVASTEATIDSPSGTYPITLTGGEAINYSFNYVGGSLNIGAVEKIELTVTAIDASSIYGEEIPTLSFSYQGFVDGEDENSLDKKPLASTFASQSSNVGTYPITISGGESQKYDFNYINGELSINPSELNVSVMDVNINKGETIPEFDISYQGFKNGDNENDLVTKPVASTEATIDSPSGTYPITLTGGEAINYSFNYVDGSLNIGAVEKIELTVTAIDASSIYGEGIPTLSFSYQGFVDGEDENSLDKKPLASTFASQSSNVGTYPITVSGGESQKYEFIYANGELSINPAELTVSVMDVSINKGETIPEFDISYQGFKNGDNENDLVKKPVASTEATIDSPSGTYPITLTGGEAINYSFNYVDGSLNIGAVEKIELTVTAIDASSIYGEEIPTLSFSYQGFVNGEDENSLDKKPLASTFASQSSNVGTYPITVSGGESQKYDFIYVNGELSINPAELTVSVMDVSINKGETIPEFDISYQGFKNGDDENDLVKKPVASTEATIDSPSGTYPITLTGGEAINYSFNYVDAILNICDISVEFNFNPGDSILRVSIEGGVAPLDIIWNTNNNSDFIKLESTGDFQVEIIDSNNCYATASIKINEDDFNVLGLEEDKEFEIWPNPTRNYINISALSSIGKVSIYSVEGVELFSKVTPVNKDRININNLKNGIYFLVIGDNRKTSLRFIIKK